MNLFRKVTHKTEDNEYEIRVYYDDAVINVLAFRNNHPATCCRYLVKLPKRCSAKQVLEKHPLEELIDLCRREITEGWGEMLAEAISESKIEDTPPIPE